MPVIVVLLLIINKIRSNLASASLLRGAKRLLAFRYEASRNRNTIWHYQQRLGIDGVTALFQAVDNQLLQHGYMARCGQIIARR